MRRLKAGWAEKPKEKRNGMRRLAAQDIIAREKGLRRSAVVRKLDRALPPIDPENPWL